jgi:hypothetical protein
VSRDVIQLFRARRRWAELNGKCSGQPLVGRNLSGEVVGSSSSQGAGPDKMSIGECVKSCKGKEMCVAGSLGMALGGYLDGLMDGASSAARLLVKSSAKSRGLGLRLLSCLSGSGSPVTLP